MDYNNYSLFFNELLKNGKFERLGKLFRTKKSYYLYDVGTGKVIQCSQNEYLILLNIFKNNGFDKESVEKLNIDSNGLEVILSELQNIIVSENLLKAPYLESFSGHQFLNAKSSIENELRQITLEVTQRCNLRCNYCYYNDDIKVNRNFANIDMTLSTAKKAIEYAFAHSGEDLAITFYGGEPLCKFDIIKNCVEYSEKQNKHFKKKLHYSLTTNLTLISREMAVFFASKKRFAIVCSLDGPKEIHDTHRISADGSGSFDKAINGLKMLIEEYDDKASSLLSINCVISPPYDNKKLNKLQDFFSNLNWLPKDLKIKTNYAMITDGSKLVDDLLKYNRDSENEGFPIENWINKNRASVKNIFNKQFDIDTLIAIHDRLLVDRPVDSYSLNACCIPGARRLYITAEGDFKVCEKVDNAPNIGNINNGIDLDIIKDIYIDQYTSDALLNCSECWAIRLCGICYSGCFDKDGNYDSDRKLRKCIDCREDMENRLITYHEILEENPDTLVYLNDIIRI